jgi:hypothetical protein
MTKARENSDYTGLQGDLALKSPVASPSFTGNVGVGVVPEAWRANDFIGLQVGTGAAVYGRGSGDEDKAGLTSNAYYDNTNDRWQHIATKAATNYYQVSGAHYFQVASSGTADSAISWKTRLRIDNAADGNWYFADYHYFKNEANSAYGPVYAASFNVVSDYRLKENVTPMTSATARTKLLKPCRFNYIKDSGFALLPPDIAVDGFIAHEVADVVPEAVARSKDAMRDEEYEVTPATDTEAAVMGTHSVPDMQGIDQSKLVPLLTATIQELIARIEALEAPV